MQIKRHLSPKMHQSLPSLLFPEYRRRVLGLLLLRPDEALHGREIARRTGFPQAGYPSVAFKRQTGQTPRGYRRDSRTSVR